MPTQTTVETARSNPKGNAPSSLATTRERALAEVTRDLIEKRAHEIWLTKQYMGHEDTPEQNWLAAEREFKAMHGK